MSYAEEAYARGSITTEERNRLVEEYLPLVRHVISRLPFAVQGFMDGDDLFAIGVLGLMNAAEGFDPTRGAKFKTYAYLTIRGAVLDELRKHDVVPRSRRDRIKLLHRTDEELRDALGRSPTPEELAVAMGLDVAQIDELLVNMTAASTLSLDDAGGSDEGDGTARLSDCVACMGLPEPSDEVEKRELLERLGELILELPDRERHVIVLYYSEGLYLKEIGAVLGVTESRVSQLHSRAVHRLHRALTTSRNPETMVR